MDSIVIYATHFGNTQKIAEAIADGLRAHGRVQVFAVEVAPLRLPVGTGLVVIGGPTEGHRMTEPMVRFFDRLESGSLRGIPAAAFDTRLRWPRWLSGSAGSDIADKLHQASARLIAPPESFFIKGAVGTAGSKTPELDAGELERAAAWGASLSGIPRESTPATPIPSAT
ncbi:MAG TPA: flavodoxin domain-containing protein [Ktedonobacterales bacterium]